MCSTFYKSLSGRILSQYPSRISTQATPVATPSIQDLPHAFFARPAEAVAPELIGCLLVKRQAGGELLRAVIVETEAYCQSEVVMPPDFPVIYLICK